MITVGSLFSGIGGLELGLERTGGFKTIWFSEIDKYASAVLEKHWPNVPNIGDITKVKWDETERPDMLAGGFPCQDISIAGKGKGVREGQRSGLWREYSKAIRILRPKLALIENVPELANRGGDVVLADLAEMGYDAEWDLLSASAVGALHRRERMFIFAYADSERHIHGEPEIQPTETRFTAFREPESDIHASDTILHGRDGCEGEKEIGEHAACSPTRRIRGGIAPTVGSRSDRIQRFFKKEIPRFKEFSWCEDIRSIEDLRGRTDIPEPLIRGGVNGVPSRMDRTKCIGNAVVPACAEVIGGWILRWVANEKNKDIYIEVLE
jgi:DNA (cytosine-5)-methyltransferase 1